MRVRPWICISTMAATSMLAMASSSFGGGGDCCSASRGLGCNDAACEATVCAVDSFCCVVAWDSICAGEAGSLCGGLCGGGGFTCTGGDCCAPSGGLGCNDVDCCNTVCSFDSFCCVTAWDSICAGEAHSSCGSLCAGGFTCTGGDCCTPSGGLGCNDVDCCNTVCSFDSFCCVTAWDSFCAGVAQSSCGSLCSGGGSNCCFPHGSLDCDDAACMDLVCFVDRFCCSVVWDQICADEAIEKCAVCTPDPVGAPVNNDCAGAIEVSDGETLFSTLNANGAGPSHPGGCVIGADIWFTYHATTPGTVTVSLCGSDFNTMLAIYDNDQCNLSDDTLIACNDNFCGTASQLSFVAGECARAFLIRVGGWNSDSGAGGVLRITSASDCVLGDINHDGAVNGADIAVVLGSWGTCADCPADTNHDGVVDGADLAIVLGGWTG